LYETLKHYPGGEYVLLKKTPKVEVRDPVVDQVIIPVAVTPDEKPVTLASCLPLLAYLTTTIVVGVILALRRRVDCILAIYALPQGLAASIIAGLTRRPLAIFTDGGDIDIIFQNVLARVISLAALRRANIVTALNPTKAKRLRSFGVTARVFPTFGIDTSHFALSPITEKELNSLLFVGRLAPEKRPSILVEAITKLRREGVRAKLTIVGDGPLRTQIEDMIASADLGDLITMKNHIPHIEIHNVFRNKQIFILPSRREGVSIALLEAMASGCLCIVSDIDDNKDAIRSMFNGILFRLDDPQDLTRQIRKTINLTDSEKVRLARNARETVEKDYSVNVVSKKLIDILKNTLSGDTRP
jgi:glycosyltransferase involved in cell wall biosynthesis